MSHTLTFAHIRSYKYTHAGSLGALGSASSANWPPSRYDMSCWRSSNALWVLVYLFTTLPLSLYIVSLSFFSLCQLITHCIALTTLNNTTTLTHYIMSGRASPIANRFVAFSLASCSLSLPLTPCILCFLLVLFSL